MKKEINKIVAKFKVKCEDFIVEEKRWDEISSISETKKFGNIPNAQRLDELEKEEKKDFLICDFEKFDIDNFRAKKELASQIRKGVDAISFAGIKDKKAWTCQRISIFQPNLNLIRNFSHPNIYLKNFKWYKRKIKLGYLEGNRFRVVLREINKKEAIKVSNQIRKTSNFANYFGLQRFGSVRENNSEIGFLIAKKKYADAINLILTETNKKEREDTIAARKRLLVEKDYKKALNYFPAYLKFERSIISYLSENKEDYIGAIKRCERKNFLLYIHALQSKIFNEILNEALFQDFDFSKKGQKKIPLFGYKSKLDEGELGKIEEEILSKNKIKFNDFRISEIPYLSLKGDLRDALIDIKNIEVEIEDDEIYKETKKVILKFDLPSGVYATTFLENFFDLEEIRN
jgi:tRNA pseudouridine13 synthase